jgi:hypothetical protein
LPHGTRKSTATDRRPRTTRSSATGFGRPGPAPSLRHIRNTVAPMSEKSIAAIGAGPIPSISMTRTPAKGPKTLAPFGFRSAKLLILTLTDLFRALYKPQTRGTGRDLGPGEGRIQGSGWKAAPCDARVGLEPRA